MWGLLRCQKLTRAVFIYVKGLRPLSLLSCYQVSTPPPPGTLLPQALLEEINKAQEKLRSYDVEKKSCAVRLREAEAAAKSAAEQLENHDDGGKLPDVAVCLMPDWLMSCWWIPVWLKPDWLMPVPPHGHASSFASACVYPLSNFSL